MYWKGGLQVVVCISSGAPVEHQAVASNVENTTVTRHWCHQMSGVKISFSPFAIELISRVTQSNVTPLIQEDVFQKMFLFSFFQKAKKRQPRSKIKGVFFFFFFPNATL